jgi:DNA-binding NtrC family response regulator
MNATHKRGSGSDGGGNRSFATRRALFCDLSRTQNDLADAIQAAKWEVFSASTTENASRALYDNSYEVGVITIRNAQIASLDQLETLLNTHPMNWIAVVESEAIDNERVAGLISDHCFDYHTLPCDTAQLISTLGHAYGMSVLRPRPAISSLIADQDSQMVGKSQAMMNLYATIKKSSRVDAPIMITGETGTGKELVARALHNQSPRNTGPFVTVSCATVPANLIGEELFGSRESGAGRIEQAIGGSLFLDSVTDLPPEQQMLLLRFMQTGQVERVNSSQPIPVDVRIITASSNNIDDAVKAGTFREDLFYRLNILHIEMPALRDRIGDVDSLAQYFFEKFIDDAPGARIKGFSQQAKIAMHQHGWPGNVRELLNRVRQSIVMCDSTLIQPADLGLGGQHTAENESDAPTNLDEVRAKAEGEFIRNALERNYNNVTETAAQLGVSRVTLYRLMKKYGVNISGSGRRATSK